MEIGKCKLCNKDNVDLQHSHIIPEFAYGFIYDKKHRMVDFIDDPKVKAKIVQKGIREYLLCGSCEVLLSKYEQNLKNLVLEFYSNANKTITTLDNKSKLMEKIKYNDIKIALLSILFRMSVSKRNDFRAYSLGQKYEDDFRDIILNNKFTDKYTYSIHIRPINIGGNYSPDQLITSGERSRYKNIYIYHYFAIYGLLFKIMISKLPINDKWHKYDLEESGKIILLDIDWSDINLKNIIKRFKDDDVDGLLGRLDYGCPPYK